MSRKLKGAFQSSQDPEQISNRVKGILLSVSSIVIFLVAKLFGINLTIQNYTDLVTLLGALSGAVWAVYGAVLALVTKFATIKE